MLSSASWAVYGTFGSLDLSHLAYSSFKAMAVRTNAKLLDLPMKWVCLVSSDMSWKRSMTASWLSMSSSMAVALLAWPIEIEGFKIGVGWLELSV